MGDNGSCTTPEKNVEDVEGGDPGEFEGVCAGNSGTIGEGSCAEEGACFANTNTIGDGSCEGKFACFENSGEIGAESW